ncbi:MAG: Uma2 family endonuclease [Cyanobacteria bacterium]|nr:Uma2 family endonuclease [Cyanobacteriota bacterium]MDW8202338.1 Uma2 family endonuclease [Cyanobacteriota bacterium SKYGB_h_bin112]
MIHLFNPDDLIHLPTAADLPDSDDTPVDNELQNLVPNLLLAILSVIWADRQDWYWGVDMGIYYHPYKPPIIPDGFLSLGVPRVKSERLRLSYVLWEESNIIPKLFLEVVSETYNGEYDWKKRLYAQFGVPYYVVYNPLGGKPRRTDQRRKLSPNQHQKLEVYHLVNNRYRRLEGNPIWIPDIDLGIGYDIGTYQAITREWLFWYNEAGERYTIAEELLIQARQELQQTRSALEQERQRAEQERQRAEQERQRAEQERQRAEQERQRAEQAEQQLAALRQQLAQDQHSDDH